MQITRLHQVAANVLDFEKTKHFYAEILGAKFIKEFHPPGLLFFEFEGTRLLFEQNNPPATLYFRVDDIHGAYAELRAHGVEFVSEPHLIHKDEDGVFGPPGSEEWMAFFTDPGQNTIALASRKPAGS